jgi:hypothetical protein
LSSFTRTIPSYKKAEDVNQLLSKRDHFLPLAFRPTRAQAGDYIYLVFRGVIVGRAKIMAIETADSDAAPGNGPYPDWARWVVRYAGEWEMPPRVIRVQGHQSVRYLEAQALTQLDAESWTTRQAGETKNLSEN